MRAAVFTALALAALARSPLAQAGGPVHGAKAAAMGTAFVAVADDASAFAYNPAGIALLKPERHFYGGAALVAPGTTYRSPSGQTETTDFQVFAPPHLFYVPEAGAGDWRFGMGIFAPFGVGGRKWSGDGLTRYSSTENMIGTLVLNPVLAGRLTPELTVGFGIDYMLAKSLSVVKVNQSFLGAGDGEVEVKGKGDGWGVNFGLLLAPAEHWRFGAAYRSRIRLRQNSDMRLSGIAPPLQPLFGGSGFNTVASSSLVFPDIVSLGVAYKPSDRTTLSFDAEQVRWSSFGNAAVDLRDEVPAAGFADSSTPMDWKNTLTLKAGLEVRMSDRLALRAGYAHVPSPVPEHTLTAAAPDTTLHHLSAGLGYKTDNGLTLDFFYMAGFGKKRTVNNALLSGRYENTMHYAGMSVEYPF